MDREIQLVGGYNLRHKLIYNINKKIKYLVINLTRNVQGIHERKKKNFNSPKRYRKNLEQMEVCLYFWMGRLDLINISFLLSQFFSKLTYKLNMIPIKMPTVLLGGKWEDWELDKVFIKLIWEKKQE